MSTREDTCIMINFWSLFELIWHNKPPEPKSKPLNARVDGKYANKQKMVVKKDGKLEVQALLAQRHNASTALPQANVQDEEDAGILKRKHLILAASQCR